MVDHPVSTPVREFATTGDAIYRMWERTISRMVSEREAIDPIALTHDVPLAVHPGEGSDLLRKR
jgi:hypothetical protein